LNSEAKNPPLSDFFISLVGDCGGERGPCPGRCCTCPGGYGTCPGVCGAPGEPHPKGGAVPGGHLGQNDSTTRKIPV